MGTLDRHAQGEHCGRTRQGWGMRLQAKECQGLSAACRGWRGWDASSCGAVSGMTLPTPGSGIKPPDEAGTKFCCFSRLACGPPCLRNRCRQEGEDAAAGWETQAGGPGPRTVRWPCSPTGRRAPRAAHAAGWGLLRAAGLPAGDCRAEAVSGSRPSSWAFRRELFFGYFRMFLQG